MTQTKIIRAAKYIGKQTNHYSNYLTSGIHIISQSNSLQETHSRLRVIEKY